jgi:hypothetical protein
VPLPSGRSYYEYLRARWLVADQAAPMQAIALAAPRLTDRDLGRVPTATADEP